MLLLLLLLLINNVYSNYDVVGWFVGSNLTQLEKLPWESYTTIRHGDVIVDENGFPSYSNDTTFLKSIELAALYKKKITLSPGVNINKCIKEPIDHQYCNNYINNLPKMFNNCYSDVLQGLEFDMEWNGYINALGIIDQEYVTRFSQLMNQMQLSLGNNYTVSCDVGLYFIHISPWVNKEIFINNSNLFVNTMSYYTPLDCSIERWKYDAWTINKKWGIPKSQINIWIGYYSTIRNRFFKIVSEPTWNRLHNQCPNISYTDCICNKTPYVSAEMNYKIGKFIKDNHYRCSFPWAANYDNLDEPLVNYLIKGLNQ